jgi:hypothetical protein
VDGDLLAQWLCRFPEAGIPFVARNRPSPIDR